VCAGFETINEKEKKMSERQYLEGFIPYDEERIKQYEKVDAYLNLPYGDILDRAFEKSPNKVAVVDSRIRLTYGELKEKTDNLAKALVMLGIRPHDRIIIQLPNRHEFVVAFYAMQKIGAIPVLAVPRHGYREISTFVRLTRAKGWIVQLRDGKIQFNPLIEKIRTEFPELGHIIMPRDEEPLPEFALCLEELMDTFSDRYVETVDLAQFRPDPNDVMVFLPTGGTTGFPKIVPRTHNSMSAVNAASSKIRGFSSESIMLQTSPVGHAMSMQGAVNTAIFNGATLVLQRRPKAEEILENIEKEKITFVLLVPTLLQEIMDHPNLGRYDVRSLTLIATAGSALPPEIAINAIEYFGRFGCKFAGNTLGASEGLFTSANMDDPPEVKTSTVGRSVVSGSHYKVIDHDGNELSMGMEGELAVKGPEVFTGYYQATSEENIVVFTSDGYYRTGDLAMIDERGYILITGRAKDIIQRGGETIMPREMENMLYLHPSIEEAAVVPMPDPRLGERACAYVVTKAGKTLTFDGMVGFLRSQGAGVLLLPERLELVESLPKTNIGKIDKKALRADIEEKIGSETKEQ